MKRAGLHIHFFCQLIVLIAVFVIGSIKPSEIRCLYLMSVVTLFALMQLRIKNTLSMWSFFLAMVGMLFLYRYFDWSDKIITRQIFIVARNAMPGMYVLFIFGSMPVSEITSGFDSLHFPKRTGIAVVTLFRYFPTMGHDVKTAYENLKLRGLGGFKNLIVHPARTVKCFLLPLFVHLYSTVEELAVSATARGVESRKKRYSLYGKKFSLLDGIITAAMLVALPCAFFFGGGMLF